jgi:hypothetical protein
MKRCAGCDIPNGCQEYCRCEPQGEAMTDSALRQAREALQAVTFTDRTAMDSRGVAQVPFATLKKCADAISAIDAAPVEQQNAATMRELCAREAEHWQQISKPEHKCGEYIAAAIRGLPVEQQVHADMLREALAKIVAKHDEWAAQMPAGGFDDPLSDAISRARQLLEKS